MSNTTRNNYNTDDKNVTENREKYVGGSDLPALLNISDYKTQFELAKEKAGITKIENIGSEYTKYGHLMEPHIREYINNKFGYNFAPATNIDNKLGIRSNCDGLDPEAKTLLEVKTNKGGLEMEDLETYIVQIQLYLYQFNVESCILTQYKRPEDFYRGILFEEQHEDKYFNTEFYPDNITTITVIRNEEKIKKILDEISLFWKRLEKLKENPEMTEIEYYTSVPVNGLKKIDYKQELQKVEVLENKLIEMKKIEDEVKKGKEKLYELMDAVGLKSFHTNKIIINKIAPGKRISVDSAKLKKEEPEIYEKYTKTSNIKGYVKITVRKNSEEKQDIQREILVSESLKKLGL